MSAWGTKRDPLPNDIHMHDATNMVQVSNAFPIIIKNWGYP